MLSLPFPTDDVITETAREVVVKNQYGSAKDDEVIIVNAVKEILDEVGRAQPLFKVLELLKVGGFNEGTKILDSNEFDFLAVLEELSHPGDTTVELDPNKPGIAKLKLNDKLNADGKWDKFCCDGYVRCMQLDKQVANDSRNMRFEIFGRYVMVAVYETNKTRKSIRKFTEIDFLGCHPGYLRNVHELDMATIKRAEARYPNVLLEFTVFGRKVEVDLCPAVRYHNVLECFSPEDCISPDLALSVIQRGSVLLVGQMDCDVRVTFTETEVDYVRNQMIEQHRIIYIYLKYVAKVLNDVYKICYFSSYILKTICIRHDIQCRNPTRKPVECLKDIFYSLHVYVAERNLPIVFNARVNLFDKPICDWETVTGIVGYRKMVPKLAVGVSTVNNHQSALHELLKEAQSVYHPLKYGEEYNAARMELLYSRRQY